MSEVIYTVIVGLFLSTVSVKCDRILAIFPSPSISHQVVFRPLTLELIKRGHNVVLVTTDPMFPKGKAPENLTEIDFHNLSYKIWHEKFLSKPAGKVDMATQMTLLYELGNDIMEAQFMSKEIQDMVRNKEKYDLVITEAYARPLLVFSHILKVPVIQYSSFGALLNNYNYLGAPSHELLYPIPMRRKLNNLTIWDKITELYEIYKLQYVYNTRIEAEENAMVKRVFGNNMPPLRELANNIDMLFLNIHPLWEGIRPVPPNVIHVSGIHMKPKQDLPQDLQSYFDSSKNGVIYISFGTNVKPSILPADKIQILVKVFSELPYDVLWKWDNDELPGQTKNIKISKWLPQSDLLRHPKLKLFITQGGLQSTDEAISAAIPMVGVPMLGDQWYNVERYIYHKIGVRVDLETLTEENFKIAINTVINDDSYRRNIVRLRSLMQDQPQTSLERAVWWTEYVLRHGGAKHLRSPAANMHWTEYYEVNLILTVLGFFIAIVLIAIFLIGKLIRCIFVRNNKMKRH